MTHSHNTQMDREMILSPYKWPLFYLPLKRNVEGSGWPEIALLTSESKRPDVERIVKVNLSIYGPIGEVNEIHYPDVDALLADGWRVD